MLQYEEWIRIFLIYAFLFFLVWLFLHFKSAKQIIYWIFIEFSGLKYIYSKFWPKSIDIHNPAPTFFLWAVGIYTALFGLASQRYESRIQTIENNIGQLHSELSTSDYRGALTRISFIQNMRCPYKPELFEPMSIIKSVFFGDYLHLETVEQMKAIVVNRKNKLEQTDLSNAILSNIDLSEANLQNSILVGADLSGANLTGANFSNANLRTTNLKEAKISNTNFSDAILNEANIIIHRTYVSTYPDITKARSLSGAKLHPDLVAYIKFHCPALLSPHPRTPASAPSGIGLMLPNVDTYQKPARYSWFAEGGILRVVDAYRVPD